MALYTYISFVPGHYTHTLVSVNTTIYISWCFCGCRNKQPHNNINTKHTTCGHVGTRMLPHTGACPESAINAFQCRVGQCPRPQQAGRHPRVYEGVGPRTDALPRGRAGPGLRPQQAGLAPEFYVTTLLPYYLTTLLPYYLTTDYLTTLLFYYLLPYTSSNPHPPVRNSPTE